MQGYVCNHTICFFVTKKLCPFNSSATYLGDYRVTAHGAYVLSGCLAAAAFFLICFFLLLL